jgi:hypothetical protein
MGAFLSGRLIDFFIFENRGYIHTKIGSSNVVRTSRGMRTGGYLSTHTKNRATLLRRIPEGIRRGTDTQMNSRLVVDGKLGVSSNLGKNLQPTQPKFFY